MKKKTRFFAFVLAFFLFSALCLTSCSSQLASFEEEEKTQEEVKTEKESVKKEEEIVEKTEAIPTATAEDRAHLENIYAGRTAYFGDIHCHPLAGVMPDGRKTLAEWKEKMSELGLDFVAFMNHRQIAHMYEKEWDTSIFIGGTEPATKIVDSSAQDKSLHYNMFFPDPTDLYEILMEFPEFNYTGGKDGISQMEGSFSYPSFTTARFQELIAAIKSKGGLFVNVHPKQQMQAFGVDPYYFADYTGLEVFYGYKGNIAGEDTKENYKLWTKLLEKGKRVWATAGSDSHGDATDVALTCIYSEKKNDDAYLSHLVEGDFVCGFAPIRMAIGNAKMGSSTDFQGKRVVFSVGAIHSAMYEEGREYTIKVFSSEGVIYTAKTDGKEEVFFSFDADEKVDFYRVEVLDEKRASQPIIAIGNPIWND